MIDIDQAIVLQQKVLGIFHRHEIRSGGLSDQRSEEFIHHSYPSFVGRSGKHFLFEFPGPLAKEYLQRDQIIIQCVDRYLKEAVEAKRPEYAENKLKVPGG